MVDYFSPFDATVVTLLRDAGAIITGKTNMDEFAMGSTSTNNLVSVVNPHRGKEGEELSAGGSSGGSAAAVAAGLAWGYYLLFLIPSYILSLLFLFCSLGCLFFGVNRCASNGVHGRAIGTDTGGSVRLPASYCGIIGFKPTYGLLSRYGIISYAHSLDTVGLFTRTIPDTISLFRTSLSVSPSPSNRIDILNKHDKHDPTSLSPALRNLFPRPRNQGSRSWTFGIPREYNLPSLHPSMTRAWSTAISKLRSSGNTVNTISLPRTREALSAYYVLATAEAASNLARYDGVRYGFTTADDDVGGYRDSVLAARNAGLGEEVRRRILLGNYTLSARLISFPTHSLFAVRWW